MCAFVHDIGGHMKRIALTIALAASAFVTPAKAWNSRGHMVVAAIAWDRMTPAARAQASVLLRINPDYATWVAGIASDDRDRIAFMQAATWPDDLRSRICTGRPECVDDDRYEPADAGNNLNIGYRDKRLRRYWHFVDIPFTNDGTATKPPFRYNAETQINLFSDSLRDASLGDEAKSFDLSWLLHMVGDVHQPLHATSRFNVTFRGGDDGGNGVIVCSPTAAKCETKNRPFKLHSLWDDAIGTSGDATSAWRKAGGLIAQLRDPTSFLSTMLARADLNSAPGDWIKESAALAQAYAYVPPIGAGKGPYFPGADYRRNAGSIAEQQIVIAGARLAQMLNRQLG